MDTKEILINRSEYFKSWESNRLKEIFFDIDVNVTKKYKLISIAKDYIKSIIGNKRLTCLSVEFYTIRGFSKEYAKEIISKIQSNNVKKLNIKRKENPGMYESNSPMKIDFWINKGLTVNEAEFKIKSFRKVHKEYWISRGYSIEESIDKIREFQSDMSKKFSDKLKSNPENYQNIRPNQKQYWIDKGFSEEESIKKVKEYQSTFSLNICVEKYGEIEGLLIFNKRQDVWKKSLNDNFKKYGDGRSIQSKWASEIIDILCNELKIKRPTKEKWISSNEQNLRCSYDFVFNNKIIEFNGDYWHANPKIYDKNKILTGGITAFEKWEIDKQKILLANSHGYEVLTIWESEFVENPNHIINKCIKFLT
jgi:hypothetical protein